MNVATVAGCLGHKHTHNFIFRIPLKCIHSYHCRIATYYPRCIYSRRIASAGVMARISYNICQIRQIFVVRIYTAIRSVCLLHFLPIAFRVAVFAPFRKRCIEIFPFESNPKTKAKLIARVRFDFSIDIHYSL